MVAARAAAEGTKAFQWIHTYESRGASTSTFITLQYRHIQSAYWVHTTCIDIKATTTRFMFTPPTKKNSKQNRQWPVQPIYLTIQSMKNISNQSPLTSKPLRICVNPFRRLSALRSERFCPCTAKLPKGGSSPSCHKASVIDGHQCFWWNGLLSLTKLKDFEVHPFCLTNWPYNLYLLGSCSFPMPFVLATSTRLGCWQHFCSKLLPFSWWRKQPPTAGNPPKTQGPKPPMSHPKAWVGECLWHIATLHHWEPAKSTKFTETLSNFWRTPNLSQNR